MFCQSVNKAAARNISAGPQLQISSAISTSQSVHPRARRASECDGTAMSSAGTCAGSDGCMGAGGLRGSKVTSLMGRAAIDRQGLPACGFGSPGAAHGEPLRRVASVGASNARRELGNHFLHGFLVAGLVRRHEGRDALLERIAVRLFLHLLDFGDLALDLGDLRGLLVCCELVVGFDL